VDTKEAVKARDRQGGGLAGTALVTASRLGVRTAYCGSLGKDDLSQFTLNEFKKEGVDTSQIQFIKNARPIHSTVIVVRSTGTRTIYFDLSGLKQPDIDSITPDLIRKAKVIFVDHTVMEVSIKAGKIARELGIPVVVDCERGNDDQQQELLKWTDHLVIGIEMGKQLSGLSSPEEIVRSLFRRGYKVVVVTVGAHGCYYAISQDEVHYQPALKVFVVDTVGCGDVFHGAYCASLARKLSIPEAIRVATVAAGIKATRPGGRTGIPNWSEVLEKLEGNLL
jgi:sugar/nucleoside kinase (ribokinase family)